MSFTDANGNRVRHLAVGTYKIVVRDTSTSQNFHLEGPGVNLRTSGPDVGEVTWTVTLRNGEYEYYSYRGGREGQFTVGAGD